MAIFKRGAFYWYEFVYNGRRIQKSTKQGDKETAKDLMAAERRRLARIDAGLESETPAPKQRDLTIGDLLDGLEADFKLRGILSVKNESNLKMARAAFDSKMKAAALTSAHVDAYISKRTGKGRAPATVNRALGLVSQAYKLAIARGDIDHAPKFRHLSEKGNERKGFFSVEEFWRVHPQLPQDLRDFVLFAYLTGWRKGEIASLTWSDVEDKVIRLRGQNAKNKEARSIAVAGDLVALIERRRQARAIQGEQGSITMATRVFHRDGAPVQEFRKAWATACRKAGVDRLFHDLRRSAVRDMVRSGVPQTIAMKISGHKTASMFRRYDISSEADLRDALLRVGEYRAAEQQKIVQMAGK